MRNCVYTFEGKDYSEKEFKAVILTKMGEGLSVTEIFQNFGLEDSNSFKEAAEDSKG